jgi:hypothetical protein
MYHHHHHSIHGKHCAVRKNKELTAKTRKKNKSPPNEGLPELRLCLPAPVNGWTGLWGVIRHKKAGAGEPGKKKF